VAPTTAWGGTFRNSAFSFPLQEINFSNYFAYSVAINL
jgi:hypothetical protein